MENNRIVCRFSCGAASAVATKLTLGSYPKEQVVILNAYLKEEHCDNRRFLADCEVWFGHPVTVLRDEKYGASVREVWRKKRFILNGLYGAPCSAELKRSIIESAILPGDSHVFGYTADVKDRKRAKRLRVPGAIFPLIERNLTKSDCLAIIESAGIQLPEMYRLGFNNANCVGCCKGGEGYWNRIRKVFPADFEDVAQIQEAIGPNSYFFRNRKTGERFSLRNLSPDAGRHDEVVPDCSLFCSEVEEELGL